MGATAGKTFELKAIRMAARGQWGVSDEEKAKCKQQAIELLDDLDPRVKLNAVKALLEMDKCDQRDEHKQLDIERDAQRQQLTVGTINNLLVSPEAVYELLERQHQDPPTIEQQ